MRLCIVHFARSADDAGFFRRLRSAQQLSPNRLFDDRRQVFYEFSSVAAFRGEHGSTGGNLGTQSAAGMDRIAHRISIDVSYPRNSCTPIETYGVVADYDPGEDAYDVLANFQGPFSIHAVLSRALKVPGNRLRLRTPPDSGGSFGVKQGVFPYIVLIAAASTLTACNTAQGAGEDLNNVGQSISNAAERNK